MIHRVSKRKRLIAPSIPLKPKVEIKFDEFHCAIARELGYNKERCDKISGTCENSVVRSSGNELG